MDLLFKDYAHKDIALHFWLPFTYMHLVDEDIVMFIGKKLCIDVCVKFITVVYESDRFLTKSKNYSNGNKTRSKKNRKIHR